MTKTPKIFIGTSGWSYNHWKENFYPKEVKPAHWLEFYASTFGTVEINATFYHIPKETVVHNWHDKVPDGFLFSVKASQYITHRKRLLDCKDSLHYFFERIDALKTKLGPILFQLPPSFKMDQDRLLEFLSLLDKQHAYTFEFRHSSWFVDEIYDILSKHNIALCITDLNEKQSPEVITADFTYLRLHGPHKAYQGSYGLPRLKNLEKKMSKWADKVSVFCYFDNDDKGDAVQDAKLLQDLSASH